jgi:hypothetical protein
LSGIPKADFSVFFAAMAEEDAGNALGEVPEIVEDTAVFDPGCMLLTTVGDACFVTAKESFRTSPRFSSFESCGALCGIRFDPDVIDCETFEN